MMVCIVCGLEIQLIHNKPLEIQIKMLIALIHSFSEKLLINPGSEYSLTMLLLKIGGSKMTRLTVMSTLRLWQLVVSEICISSAELIQINLPKLITRLSVNQSLLHNGLSDGINPNGDIRTLLQSRR